MDAPPRAPRTGVIIAALIAVALAAFVPSLPGGWIYDDHTLIAENPHAHSLDQWHSWLTNDFWHGDAEMVSIPRKIRYWRPLISASYAVDWSISGGAPIWFHVTNLIAHALVALLAFFVLRRWIGALVPAALAAALFAVHPTKAESVAWISGRTDILCTIAILIAITGIARRLRGQRGGLALEITGTLAAYLTKEQAIVLPIFVLVEIWIAADRPPLGLAFARRAISQLAPQTLLAVAYLVARAVWLPVRTGEATSPPVLDHLAAVFESMGRYLALIVAPVRLTIQQGLSYEPGGAPHAWGYVALGVVGTLGLATIAVFCLRRFPAVSLGIAVFGIAIAPTSNVMYTGMLTLISERFLYLPFFGLAWIAGEAAATSRTVRIALAGAILVFVALSARRSADYVDEEAFWGRELTINPFGREARQYRVVAAMQQMRYQAAVGEMVAYLQSTAKSSVELEAITRLAEVEALLVPDAADAQLAAIDAFAENLLEGRAPARLAVNGIDFSVDPRSGTLPESLRTRSYRLWVLRANLASRRGDPERAAQFMARALPQCDRCTSTLATQAVLLGRAGQFDQALAALDRGATATQAPLDAARAMIREAADHHRHAAAFTGDAALWEHAEELASLEAWGAAYAIIAPSEASLTADPAHAVRFAELAFRAGHTDWARAALARTHGADPDEAIAQWAAAMGWQQ